MSDTAPTKAFDTLSSAELSLAAEPATQAERAAWADEQDLVQRTRGWPLRLYQHGSDWLGLRAIDRLSRTGELRGAIATANVRLKSRKVLPLAALFRKLKPKLVLELGAGGSTYYMAALLAENERRFGVRGRLVSLEQAPDFYQQVLGAMPASLAPYCDLRLCPVRLERIGDYRAISYDTPYEFGSAVDLAYVDGPAPVRAGGAPLSHPIFSGDLVRIVRAGIRVRTAITDVRWLNHLFFKDMLAASHDVKPDVFRAGIMITEKHS